MSNAIRVCRVVVLAGLLALVPGVTRAAVELARFEGSWQDDRVVLEWETGTEINHAGFNLYRFPEDLPLSQVPVQATKLNDELIFEGLNGITVCTPFGNVYQFDDTTTDATQGQYHYWLESLTCGGGSELDAGAHIVVTVGAGNEEPTITPSSTPTTTPTSTEVPTAASTATATDTPVPTATPTNSPTPSRTTLPTEAATSTRTPTSPPTSTGTITAVPTSTPTRRPTSTPWPTATPRPTATPTAPASRTPSSGETLDATEALALSPTEAGSQTGPTQTATPATVIASEPLLTTTALPATPGGAEGTPVPPEPARTAPLTSESVSQSPTLVAGETPRPLATGLSARVTPVPIEGEIAPPDSPASASEQSSSLSSLLVAALFAVGGLLIAGWLYNAARKSSAP